MDRSRLLALFALAGLGLYGWGLAVEPARPAPSPDRPRPLPAPQPRPRPGPWGRLLPTVVGQEPGRPVEGGKVSPDGSAEIQCDLPEGEKFANKGGRDGAGLCVFASITWAAKYQNERGAQQLFEKMRSEPGGGYPEKVDRMMARYCPGVQYVQCTRGDMAFLDAAHRSGRMTSVTYGGQDGVHYRGYVAHMVNLVHLDEKWACVSDNNFIRDSQLLWMSRAEFERRWKMGGGGWAVVLLSAPPPPPPRN